MWLDLAFLFVFLVVLIWTKRAPLLWILAIGLLVQFAWEAVLAITGIRNLSLNTIVVNSLLETNMGMPYFYLIHRAVTRRWDEGLRRAGG